MVFKLDPDTDCRFLFKPLVHIAALAGHSENLVKATVKNIMVAVIKAPNPSLAPFLESCAFHEFLVSLIRELLAKTEEVETLVLTPLREKQLQNAILDLGDLMDYLRDVLSSLKTHFPPLHDFLLFCFQLFYLVQLLLPLLRYDLKIKPQVNIGLNCGLFVLNRLLVLTEHLEDLERSSLAPLFFRNKMLSPWVQSFDFQMVESPADIINFYYNFSKLPEKDKPSKFSLFKSPQGEKIRKVSSRDALSLLHRPGVHIDINQKLVPRVFNVVEKNKNELCRGALVIRDSKMLNCLVSFLKTKDDNMLLLSTNIMLRVMVHYRLHQTVKEDIADRCVENLTSEVKFRLITFENLAKLLMASVTKDYKEPQGKMVESLKGRIQILKQITNKKTLNLKFAGIFKKVCKAYDTGEMMFSPENLLPRQRQLNYLALINYSFYEDLSRLKYLELFFKYHLTDSEVIDIEIRKFILLKNLRYSCRAF